MMTSPPAGKRSPKYASFLPEKATFFLRRSDPTFVRRSQAKDNQANDLWHVDFKGPIQLGSFKLYLFVIEDDYSRYVLDVHVGFDCTADTAIARVQQAIQHYGVPRQLMSDNGRAFTSVWEDVEHRFDQTLRPYGVEHLLIPPYYPEANGKVEAFIKILSHEALSVLVVKSGLELDISNGLKLDTLERTPRFRVA